MTAPPRDLPEGPAALDAPLTERLDRARTGDGPFADLVLDRTFLLQNALTRSAALAYFVRMSRCRGRFGGAATVELIAKKLRPYQVRLVTDVCRATEDVLVEQPTGSGKTVQIVTLVAMHRGGPVPSAFSFV